MEKEMHFSPFLDYALEMILAFDESGAITCANAVAREKLGYGEEICGMPIRAVFPAVFDTEEGSFGSTDGSPDIKMETAGTGWQGGRGMAPETFRAAAYRKNQTCFPAEVRIVDEGTGQYICMSIDIQETDFLNKEVARVRQEAEQALKVKSEFVANVTHELRTPVNGIKGNVIELLEEESDPGKQKKLHLMERCCENMGTLINNILDFSKLEAGKFLLDPQKFHFKNMMDFIKESHSRKITEKGLDFIVSISDDIPEYVIGDELRIVQILNNLLSNALKFTAVGQICVKAVKTAQIRDEVELFFFVMDTGIGIDKKDEDKLFQSFSQVDASISRQYGGTGLGLNICKQLAELMGGTVAVESEKGRGSNFSFSIWVKVPEGSEGEKPGTERDILAESIPKGNIPGGSPGEDAFRHWPLLDQEEDVHSYGSSGNRDALEKTLSKLILCVEMENWEKAEGFADTVRQLTEGAPKEVKNSALRMKMAIQKENYEKTAAAFERLKELI